MLCGGTSLDHAFREYLQEAAEFDAGHMDATVAKVRLNVLSGIIDYLKERMLANYVQAFQPPKCSSPNPNGDSNEDFVSVKINGFRITVALDRSTLENMISQVARGINMQHAMVPPSDTCVYVMVVGGLSLNNHVYGEIPKQVTAANRAIIFTPLEKGTRSD
ncbi:hypothetical protein BAUCODRAFT_508994 [Baudoinia panamericana UAMH 10762]|uniref:Uncharacterized protein n=1 Tax=Baudoinia panamericana (strain UAMH 10762) TaxID=717646 RepID=M2MH06_BAUPA|nr:uncharacterized protein BAUCODRAFT_508994 [Baudoinia panamericana UAMH 10762]EMC95911.1 hypothetical protein BAUCODRAFT_508994 [Baudoinia panamericana UAMH 10762]